MHYALKLWNIYLHETLSIKRIPLFKITKVTKYLICARLVEFQKTVCH